AAVGVVLRDRHDEPQVGADHFFARVRAVVVDDRPAKLSLVLGGQQRDAVDFAEVKLQLRLHLASGRGRTLSLGITHALSTLLAHDDVPDTPPWIPSKGPTRWALLPRFGPTAPEVSSVAQNLALTLAKLPDHPWPTRPSASRGGADCAGALNRFSERIQCDAQAWRGTG